MPRRRAGGHTNAALMWPISAAFLFDKPSRMAYNLGRIGRNQSETSMFEIEFTLDATEDMRLLRKYERKQIVEMVQDQLKYRPTEETRNRKRLRPNQLAEWELRIGRFRVFYDIDTQANRVKIEAVGYKRGNRLLIHGEEYEL